MNRPGAPLFATLNVTTRCNLDCAYCFLAQKTNRTMSYPDFCRVTNELTAAGVFFINICGGEPFVHPEITPILEHAHALYRHVVTITNGTILTDSHQRTIEAIIKRKGEFPIQVSLDSLVASENSLTRGETERVLDNLTTLKALGANIVIAMVVTTHNVASISDSIIGLMRFTKHFHIMPFKRVAERPHLDDTLPIPTYRWPAVWASLTHLNERWGLHIDTLAGDCNEECGCAMGAPCMAAFTHIVIDPDLRVRPCDRMTAHFIGDLRTSSVAEVWRGAPAAAVIRRQQPLCVGSVDKVP